MQVPYFRKFRKNKKGDCYFFGFDYAKKYYLLFNFKLFHFPGNSTPMFTLILTFLKLKFGLKGYKL